MTALARYCSVWPATSQASGLGIRCSRTEQLLLRPPSIDEAMTCEIKAEHSTSGFRIRWSHSGSRVAVDVVRHNLGCPGKLCVVNGLECPHQDSNLGPTDYEGKFLGRRFKLFRKRRPFSGPRLPSASTGSMLVRRVCVEFVPSAELTSLPLPPWLRARRARSLHPSALGPVGPRAAHVLAPYQVPPAVTRLRSRCVRCVRPRFRRCEARIRGSAGHRELFQGSPEHLVNRAAVRSSTL